MKIKTKPSAKQKRRYLLLESKSKEEIEQAILEYLGVLGWAKVFPIFVKNRDNKLILAINREELTNVRAAFELCSEKIKVLRVSGTLKGLEK
ncbi:MAG: Rpp14/Pop5 family protein [Nanoarchaeota archaeon]|nr:Rpp14/Pop5 family protein [Nanoarchaeota archaeon]